MQAAKEMEAVHPRLQNLCHCCRTWLRGQTLADLVEYSCYGNKGVHAMLPAQQFTIVAAALTPVAGVPGDVDEDVANSHDVVARKEAADISGFVERLKRLFPKRITVSAITGLPDWHRPMASRTPSRARRPPQQVIEGS